MRTFLVLIFIIVNLFAKETIEVFASKVSSNKGFFEASGDVVLLYDGALIKANKATYNQKTSELLLTGSVEMMRQGEDRISSERLHINTATKSVDFKKLLLTTEEDLWILAKNAEKVENNYKIYNSLLSSCNRKKPDWTLAFAEANYHKDKNYITLKDVKLSFFEVPVFYFPYLAFSTVEERTSGLLLPQMKLSQSEGLTYVQPIYYVLSHNMDIEFDPQIRTNRGLGGHTTFRFVDSNHSEGSIRLGYFKNSDAYVRENHLNKEHYGGEFLYKSTNILPQSMVEKRYKSGLYVNATYLNDLEYLNLQKESASSLIVSNLVESRLNAFVYDDNDYFGLYGKYYIDVSKEDNKETIQELPTLHYHRFMDYLFKDKLFYTFDARVHYYTRVKGSRAYQSEFDLPVTYYDSFFNNYLDVTLSENLYFSNVFFRNLNQPSKDYHYYRNYHTLELSSDLIKSYGEDTHILHPSLIYTKPSLESEQPFAYEDLNQEQKELFVTQTERENISLGLTQYYYNKDLNLNLSHRLAFVNFPKDPLSRGDLNNEFGYSADHLNIYSNLYYSFDKEKLRSLTSSVSYNQNNYDIMLTHFYNNDFLLENEKSSFISLGFKQQYNKHNEWFANGDYDLVQGFNHQWSVGWEHRQKCWSAKLSMGQETIPNVTRSFKNNMLYFEINLNPLGGISQHIEKEFSSKGK